MQSRKGLFDKETLYDISTWHNQVISLLTYVPMNLFLETESRQIVSQCSSYFIE